MSSTIRFHRAGRTDTYTTFEVCSVAEEKCEGVHDVDPHRTYTWGVENKAVDGVRPPGMSLDAMVSEVVGLESARIATVVEEDILPELSATRPP